MSKRSETTPGGRPRPAAVAALFALLGAAVARAIVVIGATVRTATRSRMPALTPPRSGSPAFGPIPRRGVSAVSEEVRAGERGACADERPVTTLRLLISGLSAPARSPAV
ncbi:hypothetical protein GCM10022227_12050 [Streptomyces sedi]